MRPVPHDAHEPDAIEDPAGSAAYASLLGVAPRKFKKKPVIMLDPAEAETGVQLIQHLATQQWADGGKWEPTGEPADCEVVHPPESEATIAGPAFKVEFNLNESDVPFSDPLADAEEDILEGESWKECDGGGPVIPTGEIVFEESAVFEDSAVIEEIVEEPAADAPEELAEQLDVESPAAIEEAATLDPDCEAASLAQAAELPAPEHQPSFPKPDASIHRHSLRARVGQKLQPHQSRPDRIMAFLRAIPDWIKRSWL